MQGAIVMLMALSGLGCQNLGSPVVASPQTTCSSSAQFPANVSTGPVAAPGYPACYGSHDTGYDSLGYSARSAWRATLWSFVLGHDPDVPTVREIEASLNSGGSGQY